MTARWRPAPDSARRATGARRIWPRTWLLLITAAVLLLLGGWAGSLSAERTRANTPALARDTVDLVAQRLTAELTAQLNLAQALAASTALDSGDLDAFRIEANRIEALHPLWQAIMIALDAIILQPARDTSGSFIKDWRQCLAIAPLTPPVPQLPPP